MERSRKSGWPWLIATFALAASSAPGEAAVVSLVRHSRALTPAEIATGAPAGGVVHDFFVTTQADLLSVSGVGIDVPLFQHEFGSDRGLASAALAGFDASVAADSFIRMPSDTLVLGGGFSGGTNSLWGDLVNDGAQEDFLFARLTTTAAGTFGGNLAVRSEYGFESLPFAFALPSLAGLDAFDAQAVTIDYTPLPPQPPTPPVITPPVIVPDVPGSEVPEIEIVEIAPPPFDPLPSPVDAPAPGDAEEGVIKNGYDPLRPIYGGELALELPHWPSHSGRILSLLERLRSRGSNLPVADAEGVQLIDLIAEPNDVTLSIQLFGDMQTFSLGLPIIATGFSGSAGRFFNATEDVTNSSAQIPEPLSGPLGLIAIAATIARVRRNQKTG